MKPKPFIELKNLTTPVAFSPVSFRSGARSALSTAIGSPSIGRLVAEIRPPRSTRVNSSGWPSARSVRPACSTAEMWTNTSSPPSSRTMKPKPFCGLKNLTTPLPSPTTCGGIPPPPPPPPERKPPPPPPPRKPPPPPPKRSPPPPPPKRSPPPPPPKRSPPPRKPPPPPPPAKPPRSEKPPRSPKLLLSPPKKSSRLSRPRPPRSPLRPLSKPIKIQIPCAHRVLEPTRWAQRAQPVRREFAHAPFSALHQKSEPLQWFPTLCRGMA